MARTGTAALAAPFDLLEETSALLSARRSRWKNRDSAAQAIRRGFSPTAVTTLSAKTEIPEKDIVQLLALPERTWKRRKQDKKALSQAQSDRLYRLAQTIAKATDTLGARDKAVRWMMQPNRALGGASPLEVLDTEVGEEQVRDILGRIEHGIFS
jgi:putative toxin-antitoxin system antitoxin component (TIGR02293 family)